MDSEKAKDEFFKRGYGLEVEDKKKGTRMRAYFPEELRAFEQDYNDNRIVIGCSVCGRDFVIKKNAKGKRPKFCPDCREKRKKLASKKYFDSIKVSGKYTEDKAELLKMFYVMRSYDKKIQKILKEAVHIENRPILKAVARILQIFLNRFQKYLGEEQINLIK